MVERVLGKQDAQHESEYRYNRRVSQFNHDLNITRDSSFFGPDVEVVHGCHEVLFRPRDRIPVCDPSISNYTPIGAFQKHQPSECKGAEENRIENGYAHNRKAKQANLIITRELRRECNDRCYPES